MLAVNNCVLHWVGKGERCPGHALPTLSPLVLTSALTAYSTFHILGCLGSHKVPAAVGRLQQYTDRQTHNAQCAPQIRLADTSDIAPPFQYWVVTSMGR